MTECMIETQAISKSYGQVAALTGIDLAVPRGTVLGLLGHNGAGKTTLVNVLSTLLPATSGTAKVAGFDVGSEGKRVRSRIGLTGQFASVDEALSGFRNLVLIARLLGATKLEAKDRADELLDMFGLVEAGKRPAKGYSGGMRRRLDLAASLVGQPDVIFLDEPSTGLDPAARIAMWEMIERLVADGATVLLTTQHLEEADRLADSIAVLSQGRMIASGTAAELKAQVGKRTVSVRLSQAADAARATDALSKAGMTPHPGDADGEPVISMPVERAVELADVVRILDEIAVEVTDLALTEPSLDDFYLTVATAAAGGPGQ
jgi:ABC-2 type transport system ATP-binding protein